jgi:hypothetical protein
MILVGSARGGPMQLAAHLLNDRDNDHVTLQELRGFMADDLSGAMAEAEAIAKGTRCRQCVFSLSLNPPKSALVEIGTFHEVADRIEEALGLKDQPRAIVIHEKEGRRHAHVVWSRINPEQMKAIELPFFKNRLKEISRELYLENGWELPEGHKTNGWKNPLNFTLAEWQQGKRIGIDPRELKQMFQEAWQHSDNLASFKSALEEHGYFLAKGDRRGVVAIDLQGEVFSVARYSGVKAKELTEKLKGSEHLPTIDEMEIKLRGKLVERIREHIKQDRGQKAEEIEPLKAELVRLAESQRAERRLLESKQEERRKVENKMRADRFRRGLGTVLDLLTGRLFEIRRQNETEAYQGHLRDRAQRERLFDEQMKERSVVQKRIAQLRARQQQQRMLLARQFMDLLRLNKIQEQEKQRHREYEPDLEI